MMYTRTIIIGLLTIYTFKHIADSAKVWKRIPGDEKSRPARSYTPGQWRQANRFSTSRQGGPDVGNTRGGGQRRTGSNFSGPTGTSNRQTGNVRGTGPGGPPTGRERISTPRVSRVPLPPVSRYVNYTVEGLRTNYPWIRNPNAAARNTTRNSDGFTRFNNLDFLRDVLEGLNFDSYTFRARTGVRGGDGKYKVKVEQKWRKVPVYGVSIVLDQEENTDLILDSADGEFLSGIEEDISSENPSISEQRAIQIAQEYNGDPNIEEPKAKLVVDTVGEKAVLVYIVDYLVKDENQPQYDSSHSSDIVETSLPANLPEEVASAPQTRSTSSMFNNVFNFSPGFQWSRGNSANQGSRGYQNSNNNAASSRTPTGLGNSWYSFRGLRRGRPTRLPVRRSTTTSTTTAPPPSTTSTPPLEPIPDPDRPAGNNKRPFTMVDAHTGEVYRVWNGLTGMFRPWRVELVHGNPVYGYYQDTAIMYRNTDTDTCFYQTPLGNGHQMRVNDRTTSLVNNVIGFPCPLGKNSSYDTVADSPGALSPRNAAFKWGRQYIDYIKTVTANVWDWDLNIEVHHPNVRASWTGRKVELGDGNRYVFYPMTTPDTIAHEISHAFTEFTSGLEYHSQSGAINEAFSDMAAVAFMNYALPAHDSYKIGRLASRVGKSLRDMCEPRNPGLLTHRPERPIVLTLAHYDVNTALHNASALYNKAFCQLTKTATWDIQSAFRVFATANAVYWRPTETFESGACGVMKSAYSIRFTQQAVNDVINSFQTVGISCNDANWINLPRQNGRKRRR